MISTFLSIRHSVHICINSRWRTKNTNVHRRSKVSHCLNRVPSSFTAKGLCPFRNPKNIVLEQSGAKNGSVFRVKIFFFAREKHIKFKKPTKFDMDNSLNLFAAFLHQPLEHNSIIYQSNKYCEMKCMVSVSDIYIYIYYLNGNFLK